MKREKERAGWLMASVDNHLWSVTCAGCHWCTRGSTDHCWCDQGPTVRNVSRIALWLALTCNCRWPMFVTDTRPTPTNKYLLRQNTNSKIGKIPHTQDLNYHAILISPGWESGHWQILIFYRETHLESLLNIQSLTRCNLNITTSNKISLVDGAERSWGQGRPG